MSENKVTFGLEQVHVAFLDETTTESQPEWKTPLSIPGAVRWTPEAVGEASTFYADNMAYFVSTANNGYTGELEMALVPDHILAEMLGWVIDSNGMLVEVSNALPKKFALLGQVQGDSKNRRFVYYNCQASRPAKERTTQGEAIEVNTDILTLTISPLEVNDMIVVKGDLELSDQNAAAYQSFFNTVYTPSFDAAGGV